jgi:hypothetical protein
LKDFIFIPLNFFHIQGNLSTVSAPIWPRLASGNSCSVFPVKIGNNAAGVPSPTILYPTKKI